MASESKIPERIWWHEGMLLAPQHFQQLALRQEEMLHYHLSAMAPFHWGAKFFDIDDQLLLDGIFRIKALEAVMPDGLMVCHPNDDNRKLEIDLKSFNKEHLRKSPLTIHLAVPKKAGPASIVKGGMARYYSVEAKEVPDENTGESGVRIPRQRPEIRLLLTGEGEAPSEKYSSFPLTKIVFRNETYTMSDIEDGIRFVPPTLNINSDSPIAKICGGIAARLREKAIMLSNRESRELETKMQIQCLVADLPYFETVLKTGVHGVHPYALYLAVCKLVGGLAILGPDKVPPQLSYNHDDLRETFTMAQKIIIRLIDEGIVRPYRVIPFINKEGVFELKKNLEEKWMGTELTVGIRGGDFMTKKEVLSWFEKCFIGSASVVGSLEKKRILGADRKHIDPDDWDDEMVPEKEIVLFKVSTKPEAEYIKVNEALNIVDPSQTDSSEKAVPSEIKLYVKS